MSCPKLVQTLPAPTNLQKRKTLASKKRLMPRMEPKLINKARIPRKQQKEGQVAL